MKTNNKTSDKDKIKKDIRYRFELGEDLKSLANEFKISYGTLKNWSSKGEWKKGVISDKAYSKKAKEKSEVLIEVQEKILNQYKELRAVYRMQAIYRTNKKRLNKGIEEAALAREKAFALGLESDMKLHNIRTSFEGKEEELLDLKIKESKLNLKERENIIKQSKKDEEFEG